MIQELPLRGDILQEAQVQWVHARRSRTPSRQKWSLRAPEGYGLRDHLAHHFLYAYRRDRSLTKRVRALRRGKGHSGMIQDLCDLAAFGLANSKALVTINFDLALLEKAPGLAAQLAGLLAEVFRDEGRLAEVKGLRDRAYTWLKEVVDEIRACGRFVFQKDSLRRPGYASEYLRERNRKQAPKRRKKKGAQGE